MAPELLNKTHPPSFASDAFAFGVSLFYTLSGEFPNLEEIYSTDFSSNGRSVMFSDMKRGFPVSLDSATCAFLMELLHPDPLQRLGSSGLSEVVTHPWFDCDVNKLYQGRGVSNEHFYNSLVSNKSAQSDAKPRHLSTLFSPIPRTYTMTQSRSQFGSKGDFGNKACDELSLSELAAMPVLCLLPPLNA
jgi:hypothetical protein